MEPSNPIVQDVKGGRLREYPLQLSVTYGALPQTYEHPDPEASDAFTGLAGDGDPIDAVDISSSARVRRAPPRGNSGSGGADATGGDEGEEGARGWGLPQPRTGDVYPVRVIGAVAMVDGGEADWKVVTVRGDDPLLGRVTGERGAQGGTDVFSQTYART